MTVGSLGVFVAVLAMLVRRGCVLLGVFMLANIVKMRRLEVMMSRSLMVGSRLQVMLTGRMLSRLCHF